jgi:hypothetical protein
MLLSGTLSYLLHQDVQYAVTAASRVLRALCDGVRGALGDQQPARRDPHRGKPRVTRAAGAPTMGPRTVSRDEEVHQLGRRPGARQRRRPRHGARRLLALNEIRLFVCRRTPKQGAWR